MNTERLSDDREAASRERRWRWGALGIAVVCGLITAGVVVGVEHGSALLWLMAAGFVVFTVLVVGLVIALIQRLRRRGSQAFARSPLWEVGFRERNQIVKAIRRDRPVQPRHQDLALRTSRHIVARGPWPIWAFAVVSALFVAAAVLNSGLGRIADFIAAGLFLYVVGDSAWMFQRAKTYEREHG